MRKIIILAAAVAAFAVSGVAQAGSLGRPCTARPASDYLSLDVLKAKAVEQGYEVRKGEIKKACAEMYVMDKAGLKDELFLDPTTGALVGRASDADKAR